MLILPLELKIWSLTKNMRRCDNLNLQNSLKLNSYFHIRISLQINLFLESFDPSPTTKPQYELPFSTPLANVSTCISESPPYPVVVIVSNHVSLKFHDSCGSVEEIFDFTRRRRETVANARSCRAASGRFDGLVTGGIYKMILWQNSDPTVRKGEFEERGIFGSFGFGEIVLECRKICGNSDSKSGFRELSKFRR